MDQRRVPRILNEVADILELDAFWGFEQKSTIGVVHGKARLCIDDREALFSYEVPQATDFGSNGDEIRNIDAQLAIRAAGMAVCILHIYKKQSWSGIGTEHDG